VIGFRTPSGIASPSSWSHSGRGARSRAIAKACRAQKPRIGARDQVFLRFRSTCSASAATIRGSRMSTARDTCFLNIVRRHRPPCLTSGSQQGSISHHGNRSPGSGPAERGQMETPGQGDDRNKCTLHGPIALPADPRFEPRHECRAIHCATERDRTGQHRQHEGPAQRLLTWTGRTRRRARAEAVT
jgi:hypothetical protein